LVCRLPLDATELHISANLKRDAPVGTSLAGDPPAHATVRGIVFHIAVKLTVPSLIIASSPLFVSVSLPLSLYIAPAVSLALVFRRTCPSNGLGLDGLEALLREEINRLELEDDLESMPYSSQQSDVACSTPLGSALSSPGLKQRERDENQQPQNNLFPGRAGLESSQGALCRQLHDYTFTLNADF
jgi:hypothetical protein